MVLDEIRLRLRRKLVEAFGEEEAEVLLDRSTELQLEAMEQRLRAEIAGVRGEMGELRSELKTEIAGMAAELRAEMRDQTWRLTGALLVAMGLVAAILRVG
jgi:flagellar motor component MotA